MLSYKQNEKEMSKICSYIQGNIKSDLEQCIVNKKNGMKKIKGI